MRESSDRPVVLLRQIGGAELRPRLESNGLRAVTLSGDSPAELAAAVREHDPAALLLVVAAGAAPALVEAHSRSQPRLPILLVTDVEDLDTLRELVRAGAQDVLSPAEATGVRMARAVAIAACRSRFAEDRATRGHEREYDALSRYEDGTTSTAVTAQMFGGEPLSRSATGFDELVQRYAVLVRRSLEQEAFRGRAADGASPDAGLRELATSLGRMRAGPRDVVALHTRALRAALDAVVDGVAAHAYMEEARYVLVKLMGHLLSHYRSQLHGPAARVDQADGGR